MIWTIIMILAGFLAVALLDVPALIKNKKKKELVVYSCIHGLAFSICILHVTEIFTFDWIMFIDNFINMVAK